MTVIFAGIITLTGFIAGTLILWTCCLQVTALASLSLQEISRLLSLPGKTFMDGSEVWPAWLDGGISKIRDYCELDALLTYLVYLRYLLISGRVDSTRHDREIGEVRAFLQESTRAHHLEFVETWEQQA